MQKPWLAAVLCASVTAACTAPPPALVPEFPYPQPTGTAGCDTHPHLCGLASLDLGGGHAPQSYRIVFVSDGYVRPELPRYYAAVGALVAGLEQDADSFVQLDPELFHFWRVDVPSLTTRVDNQELRDTPLAAHPDEKEPCTVGPPPIMADLPAMQLAARNAVADFGMSSSDHVDIVVLLANNMNGRANAGFRQAVRMTDLNTWEVLKHELGHALFNLGDEYTEYQSCTRATGVERRSHVTPNSPEVDVLEVPNLTRHAHPAKWLGHAPHTQPGGGLLPCWFHPTGQCLMLGAGTQLCPVCDAAVREALAARRCGLDTLAPRVALREPVTLDAGILDLSAAAYDEREVSHYVWELDGVAQHGAQQFVAQLTMDPQAAGPHTVRVAAVDHAGNMGWSAPHTVEVAPPAIPEPTVAVTTATVSATGVLELRLVPGPRMERMRVEVGGKVVREGPMQRNVRVALAGNVTGLVEGTVTAWDHLGENAHLGFVVDVPTGLAWEPLELLHAQMAGSTTLPTVTQLGTSSRFELAVFTAVAVDVVGLRNLSSGQDLAVVSGTVCRAGWCGLTVELGALVGEHVRPAFFVRDVWGQEALLPWGEGMEVVDVAARCGVVSSLELPPGGVFHATMPVRFEVTGAPHASLVVAAEHSVGAIAAQSNPQRGTLTTVGLALPDVEQEPMGLWLSGVTACQGRATAFAFRTPVAVDRTLPVVHVQTHVLEHAAVEVVVRDEHGAGWVELECGGTVRRDDRAPFLFEDVTCTKVKVRSADVPGNISEVTVGLHRQPTSKPTAGCGSRGTP